MYKNIVRLLIAVMCLCISMPVYAANRAVITEGWYKIVPAHAQSKALDVGGAKTNPGANIQLWGYVGAPQQKFYVRHRGNNWYSIKAGNCDLYVDAQGGVPHNGENVHLWNWNGTDAQLWGFIDTTDGFNIYTKMQYNLVFDCEAGRGDDGTNVQLWERGDVAWHRWILIPVEAPAINTSQSNAYIWPIPDRKKITTRYNYRNGKKHSSRYYINGKAAGIDISAPIGTPVYAVADGTVTTVLNKGKKSFGKYIEITHNDGSKSLYAHLNEFNASVGQNVSRGTLIARSGNTGNSSGAHLHFELSNKDPFVFYQSMGVGLINNSANN